MAIVIPIIHEKFWKFGNIKVITHHMHKDDLKSNLQEKELSEIDFKEKNIPRQKILVHYFLSIADK